ncbi:MAG TPA: lysylphosphatidylglycerol synthase domain-containing protein [Nevskiaceae bacterium]|nr:lysylphosphatidylglycerol synthase domain-containing protein [Nevskiaceae bacterium]
MSRDAASAKLWRRRLLVAFNATVLIVFIAAVQYYWGWGRLFAPWRNLAPDVIGFAVLGMLLSYLVRATRVYLAETDIPRGQLGQSLRLILITNVFNLLLPMRSGEASFPILMHRWFGTDVRHATGTLIWLRVLDLHVIAAVGVVCAAAGWLGHDSLAADWAPVIAALCVAAPIVAYLTRRRILAWLAPRADGLSRTLVKAAESLPRSPAGLLRDLLLTWLGWGIKLTALGYILARLAHLSFTLGVLGGIGGDLSTVLPIHAPGGFGTYEAGVLILLAPGRAPTAQMFAAAVDLHLLVLTTALVAGGVAWIIPGANHRRELAE